MKHYDTTKNMTGKELTDYLRGNLKIGDIVRCQGLNCVVLAKHNEYFWLNNATWTVPITSHPSDMAILEGM